MIQATCPSCGKQYELPDQAAGKKAKCKACGAVMPIPAAKGGTSAKPDKPKKKKPARDDDPLGLGGPPDKAAADLSSLYGSAGGDPLASPASEPAGFNPNVSFSNTPSKKSAASLPMGLILGVGGGAVGLIIVVVLAIVLIGGGSDDEAKKTASTGGLSIGGGSVPKVQTPYRVDPDDNEADPDNRVDRDIDPVEDQGDSTGQANPTGPNQLKPNNPYVKALDQRHGKNADRYRVLVPPADDTLLDWTLPKPTDPTLSDRYTFRNMKLVIPAWEYWGVDDPSYQTSDKLGIVGSLKAPKGRDSVAIKAVLKPEGALDWPIVAITDKPERGTSVTAGNFIAWARERSSDLVLRQDVDVQYGLLFGGYRFVRIVHREPVKVYDGQAEVVEYIGYIQGLLYHFVVIDALGQEVDTRQLEDMIRSARIMPDNYFNQFVDQPAISQGNFKPEVWKRWRDDPQITLPTPESVPPVRSVARADPSDSPILADGGIKDGGTQPNAAPDDVGGMVRPVGGAFGINLVGDLKVVSVTRVAIRTEPLADGTWLSMEVHKLAGLERRQATPILEPDKSILLRGRRTDIPAGVETTELKSEHLTLYRLLYPQVQGQPTRRVVYVAKDGPLLITLFGNLPTGDVERLAEFDAAAMSIQPMAEDPDDRPDWTVDEPEGEDEDASSDNS
jgi:hypothetical protein